jgi:hypothetical protein
MSESSRDFGEVCLFEFYLIDPTKLVEDAHESKSLAGQPVAIDAKENIWEVEALLAKWTRGGAT